MRYPTLVLTAAACVVLAGCDVADSVAPEARQPSTLIGQSPLMPLLQDPLNVELWKWTDPQTKNVSYSVTLEITAREDLFGDEADPSLRVVGFPKFVDGAGKTVTDAGSKPLSLASVDPVASGTDGYSLVVIAMPLSESQSQSLEAALAKGAVQIDATAELVRTDKNGNDELLDGLGAFVLGEPHVSPTAGPALLIGGSPLRPLKDPLGFDLWSWTNTETRAVSYWSTVEVLVDVSLLQGDPHVRVETSTVYRGGMGNDILTSHETAYVTNIDPLAVGTDGYALVVIALPLSKDEADQLRMELSRGSVEVDVKATVVTTAANGKDEQLDALRSLQIVAPRRSELSIPDKFTR